MNTSRLWYIFESAIGANLSEQLTYEQFATLIRLAQTSKDQQATNLSLMEREHGELLIKMKEIQVSLETFRTSILDIVQQTHAKKARVIREQQLHHHAHEQSVARVNQLLSNVDDVQVLLADYKSVLSEVHHLIKLIYQIQTQLELHHKSTLIYRRKLDRYKQDLALAVVHRAEYAVHRNSLQKTIRQQTDHLQELDQQQRRLLEQRQQFHQRIQLLDRETERIVNDQQNVFDAIKQARTRSNLLRNTLFQSNQSGKDQQYSLRQLMKTHRSQQDRVNYLDTTIQHHSQRRQLIRAGIDQIDRTINEQTSVVQQKQTQIESRTKDLHELESRRVLVHNELQHLHGQVDETKAQLRTLGQQVHRLTANEKPFRRDIARYEKQLVGHRMHRTKIQSNLKQNQTRIDRHRTALAKLNIGVKHQDEGLSRDQRALQHSYQQIETVKQTVLCSQENLEFTETNYRHLRGTFAMVEKENSKLKQQQTDLTFLIQLLGQRQVSSNYRLQSLYNRCFRSKETIAQAEADLCLLHKYHRRLQLYNQQLQQSLTFQWQRDFELANAQHSCHQLDHLRSQLQMEMTKQCQHVYYWHSLMISAPDEYNRIAKLFLIKSQLVDRSHELASLKRVVSEKEMLCHYLTHIHRRLMLCL